jgi:hypothetical protein
MVVTFHEIPSSWSQAAPCGKTDRHGEASIRFRCFAKAPQNWCMNKMNLQREIPAGSVIKGYIKRNMKGAVGRLQTKMG